MTVYLPNISSVHVKCGLMSSKVRLDIASHSISLITIDFYIYRVWTTLYIPEISVSNIHSE